MINILSFVHTAGYVGIAALLFAESGILIGFFLPGDSLLFTAGLLAAQGNLNIVLLIIVSFAAAVIGDSVGYYIGKRSGPMIFTQQESRFFHPDQITKANAFFDRHGAQALILARFIPVIRTLTPTIAGIGQMKYGVFLTYNIIGGLLWTAGLALAGFYLGRTVPNIDEYIIPIIIGIIIISLIPSIIHFFRKPKV